MTAAAVEPFAYSAVDAPPLPAWEAFGIALEPVPAQNAIIEAPEEQSRRSERQQAQIAEQVRQSFEQGRERGFKEGREVERQALTAGFQTRQAAVTQQVRHLMERFNAERARYFEEVESEVVKLALAIAARILRREAQMDPLLLSGAVRVALGQLSSATQVRLRVPPADLELWAEAMAHLPNLAVRPAVAAGEEMRLGDCVLETEFGSVDLGVGSQLGEIERGFFDGPGRNPAAAESMKIREDMSE
jgi:flagellar assembly protein FliH